MAGELRVSGTLFEGSIVEALLIVEAEDGGVEVDNEGYLKLDEFDETGEDNPPPPGWPKDEAKIDPSGVRALAEELIFGEEIL
ncbi:hypothetical protein BGZ49_002544 [Haplosporangium sp. Z 27]|nr:hypothetical protein BGZ49_002544 [Haplosporangium sp. Z 27]